MAVACNHLFERDVYFFFVRTVGTFTTTSYANYINILYYSNIC